MVETLNLDQTIPWKFVFLVVIVFIIIYAGARASALVLMLLVLLVLYFDFSEPDLGCEKKTTKSVCDFYVSNQNCPELKNTFDKDPEWANYRYSVQNGLPADKSRLLNGYNLDYFPDCVQTVDQIQGTINGYDGKSNLPKTEASFLTIFNPVLFLALGSVGALFSVSVLTYRLTKN